MPRPPKAPYRCFKIRWEKRGAHIHAAVFVANHPRQTFASCGSLVMPEDDFRAFRREMPNATFEERANAIN